MILSRRSVLFSLIAAPIVVRPGLLMPVRVDVPWIMGDGVHDDAAGLQALIDGERHRVSRNFIGFAGKADGVVRIHGGVFRLSKCLYARAVEEFHMTNSTVIAMPECNGTLSIYSKGVVTGNRFTFEGTRERAGWSYGADGITRVGAFT